MLHIELLIRTLLVPVDATSVTFCMLACNNVTLSRFSTVIIKTWVQVNVLFCRLICHYAATTVFVYIQ
jgi:hypothetical protein